MATYKVGSDGNAPKGLQVGDLVVTGGGTYQIVAPNTAGASYNPNTGYWSILANQGQTTSNYNGTSSAGSSSSSRSSGSSNRGNTGGNITEAQAWAENNTSGSLAQKSGQGKTTAPVAASNAYNANIDYQALINDAVNRGDYTSAALYEQQRNAKISGMGLDYPTTNLYQHYLAGPNIGNMELPEYQEADTSGYEQMFAELMAQLQQPYTPVDMNQYTQNVMTQEEAVALAEQILSPRYEQYKNQALTNAGQNLDRAGLYNSVYGQGLSMAAENQISAERQQAINELAMQLMGQDRDWAMQLLNAAINENQFGAGYRQSGLSTAASASLSMINSLVSKANARNDYALQLAAMEIEKQAAALEAQYQAGRITQTQLENRLYELEIQAAEAEMASQSQVYKVKDNVVLPLTNLALESELARVDNASNDLGQKAAIIENWGKRNAKDENAQATVEYYLKKYGLV